MNDLVREIIDNYPDIIKWPEKKQISFDPKILSYSTPTIGGLIVKSSLRDKYNFQDLKSTLDFLKDYLNVELKLEDDLKSKIIKYQALRNSIVHNSSKVDEKFLKQVKNLSSKNQYKNNDIIKLNESDYTEARDSFKIISSNIIEKINKI